MFRGYTQDCQKDTLPRRHPPGINPVLYKQVHAPGTLQQQTATSLLVILMINKYSEYKTSVNSSNIIYI